MLSTSCLKDSADDVEEEEDDALLLELFINMFVTFVVRYCHVMAHGDDRGKTNTILPLN